MNESMSDHAHNADGVCRNCGHRLTGAYCASCGQAEHDGHPPTIGHFVHDLLHEFLHVDGTIFRTLKALFFQPGELTQQYWAGHVVSWLRPIRIFLTIVALQLLASTGVGPLNLQISALRMPGGDIHFSVANAGHQNPLPAGGVPLSKEQNREFSERFTHAYAGIRYFSVLLFACAVWALYRKRQPYFAANLILSLHFYSFWYVLALIGGIAARWLPVLGDLSLLSWIYLLLALGRLFHERWYVRVAKTFALYIFLMATELVLGMAAGWWASRLTAQ